jgi:hypothetical protein
MTAFAIVLAPVPSKTEAPTNAWLPSGVTGASAWQPKDSSAGMTTPHATFLMTTLLRRALYSIAVGRG